MSVLGYTYEADYHCLDCAAERFRDIGTAEPIDNEGNPVNPIFASQIFDIRYECEQIEGEPYLGLTCGTCGERFAEG